MTQSTKSKERNLERVRINQQRSRDRKRQYTAELEKKVQLLEQRLRDTQASTEVDSRVAKLVQENRVRSDLLCVLGIDKETQDRFLRAASARADGGGPPQVPDAVVEDQRPDEAYAYTPRAPDGNLDMSTASTPAFDIIPNATSPIDTVARSTYDPPSGQFDPTLSELMTAFNNSDSGFENFSLNITSSNTNNRQTNPNDIKTLAKPADNVCTNCSSCTSLTTTTPSYSAFPSDSTTACSIAFSMILQNNKRGYKFIDLETRMRAGYQKSSSPGEECRVLNKVLFAVLAEIT